MFLFSEHLLDTELKTKNVQIEETLKTGTTELMKAVMQLKRSQIKDLRRLHRLKK